jgi:hypothetical protein
MALNFNVDPYYDDFDPSKHFHRILFKPGYAVQARELTQSQTILQDQITKFANNLFTQNTPITGGKVTINTDCYYLKLNTQFGGNDIVAQNFLNKTVIDDTGTVLAKVIATAEGSVTDPPTLIVSYISGIRFTDGMTVSTIDGTNIQATTIGTAGGTTCTGKSSTASISEGVFYIVNGYSVSGTQNADGTYSKYSIGNFVTVSPQTVILDKYSSSPSYRVGLSITETITDYIDDPSLLDPAVGASNYQAPGADRYTIILTLITLPLTVGNDDQFIELMRIQNGSIIRQVDGTVYSVIDDYFAKRTYDTNGDYVVNDFKLTPKSNTTNQYYDVSISKGVAYVRGYRLENQSDYIVSGTRARDTAAVNNNPVSIEYGNFFYVSNVKGSSSNGLFDFTTYPSIDLHTVDAANIVSANVNTYNSTKVGTARIRGLDYSSFKTSAANTSGYIYKAYISDLTSTILSSNANTATTTTISFYDPSGKFSTTSNAYLNTVITIDSGTSKGDSRSIVSYNGATKTATVNQPFSITPDKTSNVSLRFSVSDIDSLVSANPAYSVVSSAAIDDTGRLNGIPGAATLLQDPGYSNLIFDLGQPYVANTTDTSYSTTKTFRSKSFSGAGQITIALTLPSSLNFKGTGTLSSSEVLNYFTIVNRSNGQILNWTGAGNTISISANKLTATVSSTTLSTPLVVDVIASISAINADDTSYVLKAKNLVTGNTLIATGTGGTSVNTYSYIDLTNGQTYIENAGIVSYGNKQSLYVSDVKKIRKIIETKDIGTPPTVAMLSSSAYDITSYFSFDNGQRDSYYDHASITLKPGAPKPKGNILVVYDFYSHSGGDGYFSVMSYLSPVSSKPESYAEIPVYVAQNGLQYRLSDCADFRPTRQDATTQFIFDYTTDPASTDSGIYIPDNLSTYTSDYAYYLGKKALIVLSKDKNFELIQGSSSVNPVFPTGPEGSLVLGKISLDPYTAYLPNEAPAGISPNLSIETVQHRRWAMQDISSLNTRVNNLEYYTSLSLLESKASSLQVKDVNGLNRFKNGILVDDFSSSSVSDTSNPNFSCAVDKVLRKVTPEKTVQNYPLINSVVQSTMGKFSNSSLAYNISKVNQSSYIFTLPYTTSNIIVQQIASSTLSVNPFNVTEREGVLDITPPMDNWIDNTRAPDLVLVDKDLQIFQQSNTVNVLSQSNWQVIPGTENTTTTTTTQGRTTTTTTTVTGNQSQTTTLGSYSKITNTYSLNNNFITDISIQPFIRPQQILVRGLGLKVNTPMKAWFDGQDVSQYMTQPDTIELTSVSGTFNDDDSIGYVANSVFVPVGTVVSVYNYPNTSNTRLYVTGNKLSAFYNTGNQFDGKIRSAVFNTNGSYANSPAQGTITTSSVINVHKSGTISLAGGSWQDKRANTLTYYRVNVGHGSFAEMYGIWGQANAKGASLPAGTFNFNVPETGRYWLRVSSDDSKSGYIRINGTTYWSSTLQSGGFNDLPTSPGYINLNKGNNTFQISCTSSLDDGVSYIAAAITGPSTTSPWTSAVVSSKPIILSTAALNGPGIANTTPTNGGTATNLSGGGTYYVGATQLVLNGIASNTSNFYVGCKINIQTINIDRDAFGSVKRSVESYSATITAYDFLTKAVTLNTPVNVSMGMNQSIGGDITSTYTINGTVNNYALARQQGAVDALSTDENGTISAVFNVPQGSFRIGERVFRFDNRNVDTDPNTADTFAQATFYASGLTTKSQSLSFGASLAGAKNTFTRTDYKRNVVLSQTVTTTTQRDPLCQTFIVDSQTHPYGVFLDSVTLYFSPPPGVTANTGTLKSVAGTTESLTVSIVNTLNGYPNGDTLDYSIVTKLPSEVRVSSRPFYLDPTTATKFKFKAPVYIQPDVLYAMLLKSPSNDYYPYLAAQGGTTIPSTSREKLSDPIPSNGQKIGNTPYVGSIFESQNGITWVADPTKSMMMVFDRCVFNTSNQPTINFVIPQRNPTRKNITTIVQTYKDADIVPNLDGSYSYSDVISDAYNFSSTDFNPSVRTSISYSYNSITNNGRTYSGSQLITPGRYGCPTLDTVSLSDGLGPRVILANTNNSLIVSATLSSSDDTVSPVISDDGLAVYNIKYNINNLPMTNSQIVLIDGGRGYANGEISSSNIIVSAPDIVGGEQAIVSANVANNSIESMYVIYPGSGYLNTPTITLLQPNTTIATVNTISEFSPTGGNGACKYITKKVTLAAQSISQDLRVFFTAYRPQGTNIFVFYKILSPNDNEQFENNPWELMTLLGDNKNSYSLTENDLYEYEAAPGTGGVADNYISYVGTNGVTYYSFSTFAIKIVMTTNTTVVGSVADDTTTVPFLTDIRALALPSGTGI